MDIIGDIPNHPLSMKDLVNGLDRFIEWIIKKGFSGIYELAQD